MGLFRKNSRVPPSGSTPGQPCAAAAAAAGTHLKQLSRLHRAAASANMAWLRRWRWLIKIWGFDRRDGQNRTPLHLACANGHAGVANFLLRQHCQLNAADNSGRTPLMMAVQFNRESCVTLLLRRGADPNLTDVSGNTALHLAVLFCDVSVVQQLLRRHARLDAENKEGFTPLSLAVSKGQAEIAEFLRKKAAGNQDRREPAFSFVPERVMGKRLLLRASSPSDQVAASEAQEEEEAEPAGDPDEVFILNSPLWREAFGSTLDAAAVERGGAMAPAPEGKLPAPFTPPAAGRCAGAAAHPRKGSACSTGIGAHHLPEAHCCY